MSEYVMPNKNPNPSPSSLEVISFNAILMKIWKSSSLPNQIMVAMNRQTMLNDNDVVVILIPRALSPTHSQIVDDVQAKIMTMNKLPKYWKIKVSVALQRLNFEILYWANTMVMNLNEPTWNSIMLCYENIIISQEGTVEKRKTIVNVLQESKFKVTFRPSFLSRYCVERNLVNDIYQNTMRQISERQRFTRKRKLGAYSLCLEDLEEIKRYVSLTQDVRKFWLLDWIKARQWSTTIYWRCNFIQYVATKECVEIMKYFTDLIEDSELQENLTKTFKFIIKHDLTNSDMVMFFYQRLETESWNTIMERNFHLIIYNFIKCWRYRSYAVKLFNIVKHDMDVRSYCLLLDLFKLACNSVCTYLDLAHIIRSIWLETPLHLRKNPQIIHYSVPDLIILGRDFYLLYDMIKDYDHQQQLEVASHVVYCLIAEEQSNLVDHCIQVLTENGVCITCYQDLINKTALKQFVLNSLERSDLYVYSYKMVKDFFIDALGIHLTMFEDVFRDKDFSVEFLSRLCQTDLFVYDFDDLMRRWYCNEYMLRNFKKSVISDKWIIDVYERLLMDPKALPYLYKPIIYLDLKDGVDELKSELRNKPNLMENVFTKLLKQKKCTDVFSYLNFLYLDFTQHKVCIQKFLLSQQGVEAVINNLVLYLENTETELTLRFNLESKLDLYSDFNDCWLKPYNLERAFDEKLIEYGHPNLRSVNLKIRNCFNLKGHEVKDARRMVDANYRFLRAIINGNFDRTYYKYVCKNWDLTTKSIEMAGMADIFVADHF